MSAIDYSIAGVIGRFRQSLREPRKPKSITSLLRMWWHDFVIHPLLEGHEICEDCGRDYPLWFAPDAMWKDCMGGDAGLLCPSCFSDRMDERGVIVQFAALPFDRSDPAKWRELIESHDRYRAALEAIASGKCLDNTPNADHCGAYCEGECLREYARRALAGSDKE